MNNQYVKYQRGSEDESHLHYGLGVVTLTRPDALNAINVEMAGELSAVMDEIYHDNSIRCVLLKAEGRFFMAGGDLPRFAEPIRNQDEPALMNEIRELIEYAHEAIRWMRYMYKPVVGLVTGGAAGYGLSLMLACDFIVTHEDAVFTLAYSGLGTSPDGGATFFLPRLVGTRKAAELIMLSDRFTGAEAAEMGIVNQAVPKDQLQTTVDKLLDRLLDGPTFSYGKSKMLVNNSLYTSLSDQLEAEAQSFRACAFTEDFKEGITAFVDKRKPDFKGS
ncbi:MAG: enoyl-CoA hydratase-related protein [Ketobacteraceae bacterium]|nr:enoyl-CoA hydratase-related protein [Ketobacteraceae bacterium]